MRNTFGETFYKLAKQNPKLVMVVADISPAGALDHFRQEFPDRFINTGVAEQVMIGMAAGMSMRGLKPFAYTIATFSLYRPFEFIRNDLGYQNLPVTIVGMGAGVVYSTLGATHQAFEDIAVASSIPNMQVLAPCDPLECIDATLHCAIQDSGPIYLRIGKAGEPTLTKGAEEPFVFGKVRFLLRGDDICFITYGTITVLGLEVVEHLRKKGKATSLAVCHTLKPIDKIGISEILQKYKHVIVIEEHVPQGGLSAQIKGIAWDISAKCKLNTFTLQDSFIHNYGTHGSLLNSHGLVFDEIFQSISC